jgi:hypothetical protein
MMLLKMKRMQKIFYKYAFLLLLLQLNPFLYPLCNENFKRAFKRMLRLNGDADDVVGGATALAGGAAAAAVARKSYGGR